MVFYLFLFLSAGAVNSLPFSSLSNRRVIQTRLLSSSDTTTNCYDERQPGIYVLGLQNGKYYVGKSIMNVTARVQEHFLTGGSAWTKLHQPKEQLIPILNASDDLESSERAETLERMWMHGIDNVRGWQYTTTKLNEYNYESIFREMCERKDLCRKCGRQNHMASSCNYRDLATWVEPGRLPNREMILQGGDTRKKKAADRIASMVISDGDNQQKSSQQPVQQQQQQQQQSRGGKWNSPNTGMTKQKPTTAVVSAKAIAVESTTIGITAVTTNERFTGVGDNVRSGIGPKEQIPRRKETATAITNAAVAATTPQIRKYVSSSSSLPRQSTTTEARITGNIAVDVTANTSNRPQSTPASSFDAVTAVPAAVTAVVMASNGAVVGATAGLTAASTKSTKPNSNKKRLKNDADGSNSNNNNNNNKKVTKSRKALWTAATQSFLFNAALACLYRSSASRWLPFSLYHVLLTPILEPQTLLWVQWLDTKVGRGRLKPSLLALFTLFSTVFLVSCWRLVASRELKAIQVAAMVLARSAGQAMLWLPWLTSEAATAAAVVAGSADDFTAITTTAATATAIANPNPNNGTRRKQKPNEGRRGTIAASSLTGLLGLLFGWLMGGGSGHVYSF